MTAKRQPLEETHFLNVDLDIEAPNDLAPLVEALAPNVHNLHTGPGKVGYQTHLELSSQPQSAEVAIRGFIKLLVDLSPRARRLWDEAIQRDFNVGIQAGTEPYSFEFALKPDTLRTVAQLGARIVTTVYAVNLQEL
jgi:hypothetical protein